MRIRRTGPPMRGLRTDMRRAISKSLQVTGTRKLDQERKLGRTHLRSLILGRLVSARAPNQLEIQVVNLESCSLPGGVPPSSTAPHRGFVLRRLTFTSRSSNRQRDDRQRQDQLHLDSFQLDRVGYGLRGRVGQGILECRGGGDQGSGSLDVSSIAQIATGSCPLANFPGRPILASQSTKIWPTNCRPTFSTTPRFCPWAKSARDLQS